MIKSFVGRENGEPFLARDGVLIFELFRGAGVELKNMSLASGYLKPGQKAIPHRHKKTEEIYFIVSGAGKVRVGEIVEEVKSGEAVYVPPGAVHALENGLGEPMKILAICSPAYDENDIFFVE